MSIPHSKQPGLILSMRCATSREFSLIVMEQKSAKFVQGYDFATPVERRGSGSLKWQKYEDRDILPLWVADMDFPSPPEVVAALESMARRGVFGYTVPYPSVRESVVEYLARAHGVEIDPAWIVWLPGLVPALNLACHAFSESGDAVMTATPVYPPFLTAPVNARRGLQAVPLIREQNCWTFDQAGMEEAVTAETRIFILCNPHNPVGRVFSRAELEWLADFCERHDLILISDEIHCDLILDDQSHVCGLALGEGWRERIISLFAPSKTYNLPGLACAFGVIPSRTLRARFERATRGIFTEVNIFGYAGCEAAYRQGEPWRQALLKQLRQNRQTVYEFFARNFPQLPLYPMEATYLAWFDARPLGIENPTAGFEAVGVGLSDGTAFGAPGWLRLNFGCPPTTLKEALARMTGIIS